MERKEAKNIIEKLLREIEEEDIGSSLFNTVYQNQYELCFFQRDDRAQVVKILKRLSEDSRKHKEMLHHLIGLLGGGFYEK